MLGLTNATDPLSGNADGDAITAVQRGDIAEFKHRRAFLQSTLGHLRY